MVYIQGAYRPQDRPGYLREARPSRSVPLLAPQKQACLRVLDAWEDYLEHGHLCDVDTLTGLAAPYFDGGGGRRDHPPGPPYGLRAPRRVPGLLDA